MNSKPNEPGSLRAHLLDEEPIDVDRQTKLQQEIDAMFVNNLTRTTRFWWIVVLTISILSVIFGMYVAVHIKVPLSLGSTGLVRAVWILFTISMTLMATFGAIVLYQGKVDLRARSSQTRFNAILAMVCSILLFVQAAVHPSIPNLAWAIFAMLFVMIATANRVITNLKISELQTREALLRLELKLDELEKRLPGSI